MNIFSFNINSFEIQQENIECIHYKRNQIVQEHNQLLFIQKSLEDRLEVLRSRIASKSNTSINRSFEVTTSRSVIVIAIENI